LPLKAGTSQQTISDNISETMESSTFAKGKSRKKKHLMAIAAAHRKKRQTLSQAAMKRRRRK
jgi:hypothetical protein